MWYRVYSEEGGGFEYVGRLKQAEASWTLRFFGGFRFYVQNFQGTFDECLAYARSSFKGRFVLANKEVGTKKRG